MNKHLGERFEDFLDEIGEREETELLAQKKMLADAFRKRMTKLRVSPTVLAQRMRTSRNQVYRLLDPKDPGVTLDTLQRASVALDLRFSVAERKVTRRKAG